MKAYLSLGSNHGDRRGRLLRSLDAIAVLPRTRLLRASSIYQTRAVGVRGQRDHFNCCAELETSLSPMGLLVALKRIEAAAGRRPGPRWGARPLDVDILFYGRIRVDGPFLTIPHPRALERRFVLVPLCELVPRWSPPAYPRRSVACWLERLSPERQPVRRV
ncbi:MAG: 2-amino-4-hydroxy-6-hydroxymethyldihydropteridine diphosphokinase [Elusimicrobia bacterium]|nr:2-amino-4-hydroxy-6-hydroxymethyldihydropteridine diphosphokinase [Elusimicrobiota bacterium]